jgi:hypothetical protein
VVVFPVSAIVGLPDKYLFSHVYFPSFSCCA